MNFFSKDFIIKLSENVKIKSLKSVLSTPNIPPEQINLANKDKDDSLSDMTKIGVVTLLYPRSKIDYVENIIRIMCDLDCCSFNGNWLVLKNDEINFSNEQKLIGGPLSSGVDVLFDKIKEILSMRWFESKRLSEWEEILNTYSKMSKQRTRILLSLINYSDDLPNSTGSNIFDPYEADNQNIIAFLQPLFEELQGSCDTFARHKVEDISDGNEMLEKKDSFLPSKKKTK